jgi:hypothetical protein
MKFFGLLALALMSLPAFSQTCYVDMVHTPSGRVVRSFTAYGDPSTCQEGMKECRKSIRFDYSSNPQYPASSLDCLRARDYGPVPTPVPVPNPYPQPHPTPNPYPGSYQSIDANLLILDVSQNIYSSEVKSKIIESLVANINSYNLAPLVRVCASTTSWQQNASCLVDGVARAPRELTDENTAIRAVGRACVITTSWTDEASCFSQSLRNNRLPSLGYLAQSCSQMYGSEQQSRCFRQVFGM